MDRMLSGMRILVIEDEMLITSMIEDMLLDLGCQSVAAAATISQAVTLIDEQEFDAALLDMNLNGCTSCAVADALTAHGVPFVFSTGNSDREMWKGYEEHSALRKPFSNSDVVAALSRLLAQQVNRHERFRMARDPAAANL